MLDFQTNGKRSSLIALNLRKRYGRRVVVDDVSLYVKKGEIVGLLGANGAGKTTTFYMIVGLEKPDEGRIILDGQDVTAMPMYLRARLGLGYLPQESSIFRKMSAEDNIYSILETRKMTKYERSERLERLLREFGIEHVRHIRGDLLSGGERRRVEIARCLAMEPKFILLDEPFAGIDPIAIQEIQEIIVYLKKQGIGVLVTDHNVRETLRITDRAYIISDGKILRSGKPEELVQDSVVRKAYLGEKFTL
ncbi:MAG: LPS export ABC transporter ATP-binding protein [Pyrinomonadaceae bacterium]|nr:LPS export ABC transporter ATP-binding protein [Pyrinomonadaceae bacterium]MCX7639636.1 LPS export ABC transporter ATP-binding protein [Pyrinomonadaceae bacterium]MDW8303346.1 LPS export ABC transporter ATP-binding protein [Acidobacteriota bacterium]